MPTHHVPSLQNPRGLLLRIDDVQAPSVWDVVICTLAGIWAGALLHADVQRALFKATMPPVFVLQSSPPPCIIHSTLRSQS